jgi:hypothetical protein
MNLWMKTGIGGQRPAGGRRPYRRFREFTCRNLAPALGPAAAERASFLDWVRTNKAVAAAWRMSGAESTASPKPAQRAKAEADEVRQRPPARPLVERWKIIVPSMTGRRPPSRPYPSVQASEGTGYRKGQGRANVQTAFLHKGDRVGSAALVDLPLNQDPLAKKISIRCSYR